MGNALLGVLALFGFAAVCTGVYLLYGAWKANKHGERDALRNMLK